MTRGRGRLAIGVAGLAVVGIAVGLSLALIGGGGSKQLTHADFVRLWQGTNVGEPAAAVLARWPKTPYQHYSDSAGNDCYEFADASAPGHGSMPQNLYNLCFKHGVLLTKTLG